jgi:hypothetical protein
MKALISLLLVALFAVSVSAQFQFCGTGTPYNVTLAPHSTQWLFVWNAQGNRFNLDCVSVVPPSDSKIFVDVSVAYSPNHASGPFSILRPLGTQYNLQTNINVQYPTAGYFYLVASNMLPASVNLQFQADGNVSSSRTPKLHSLFARSGMPNLGQPIYAVRRRPQAQFNLCQKNFNATIPGRTAQNLMYWTEAAMTLTVTCLEVTAAQQNPSSLELWIACGPQATTGPVVKLMQITNQAQPEAAIAVSCPIRGYFRFTAFNNDGTTANLQFGASGNVFLPDGNTDSGVALF